MTSNPTQLPRIERLSRLLAGLCLLCVIALPILIAVGWYFADANELSRHAGLQTGAIQHPLLAWQRMAGAFITAVPACLLLWGVWRARRCFLLFAEARYFEIEVVRSLRGFAAGIFSSVLASIPAGILLSIVLTLNNAPGSRQLTLAFSSGQLSTLFVAGMVWVIAAVMTHATALAAEHAQFI